MLQQNKHGNLYMNKRNEMDGKIRAFFPPYFSNCAKIPEGHEQIWSQQCGNYQLLHWSGAKSNWAHSRSHTQNLTHTAAGYWGSLLLTKDIIRVFGGWSSRLEAAVPVKTHSGGTAHLGGHASHANLASFTRWIPNDLQLAHKYTDIHIYIHKRTLTPILHINSAH